MTSDREQFLRLVQRGDVRTADVSKALLKAGIAPSLTRWRAFIDSLLLWLGASSVAAGVLFFIAYNWDVMGRFAKFALVQGLMIAAVGAYFVFSNDERLGKVTLFIASVLLGVLLALFGQTYQTGADPWQLFATWAFFMLPWMLVARFSPMWLMWVGLLNVAWLLYGDTFRPELGGALSHEQTLFTGLLMLNALALAVWEWRLPRHHWLQEIWSPRVLSLGAGVPATLLGIMAITVHDYPLRLLFVLVWLAFIVLGVWFYRYRRPDLFMLAGACFSGGAMVLAFLIEHIFKGIAGSGGQFLFMAVAVIALGTGSAVWLRRTQKALIEEAL